MNETRYRAAEAALWASVGVQPTERFIDLDRTGARARVQEVGDGPPVLFIHGASNAGASWASLVARLAGFRCILLDRPGCGLSARLPAVLADIDAFATYAEALAADVLDALGIERAHVVGTSLGGYYSLRAAAAHPSRIDRLVLLSWSTGAPLAATPIAMRIGGIPVVGKLMTMVPPTRAMVRWILKQIGLRGALESGRFGDVEIDWFLSVLRDTDTMRNELDAAPRLVTMKGLNTDLLFTAEVLGRITAPTLFLWGEDDPQGGESIAGPFAALVPGAELEMVEGAGHAPWMDDPDAIATRVGGFLAGPG